MGNMARHGNMPGRKETPLHRQAVRAPQHAHGRLQLLLLWPAPGDCLAVDTEQGMSTLICLEYASPSPRQAAETCACRAAGHLVPCNAVQLLTIVHSFTMNERAQACLCSMSLAALA